MHCQVCKLDNKLTIFEMLVPWMEFNLWCCAETYFHDLPVSQTFSLNFQLTSSFFCPSLQQIDVLSYSSVVIIILAYISY